MLSLSVLSCSACLSVCDVGVLWPNGWMDQDATWHAGRPRPWPHCIRWGPSSPPQKGADPPIFGPYLLWPNSWMDQDATWYGGSPQPKRHFVRWRPSSPSPKGFFGPCLLWPEGWMDQDATWHEGRPQPKRHCVRWRPSSPSPKRTHTPIFGPYLLRPNGSSHGSSGLKWSSHWTTRAGLR